ncbi:phosphoribosyltransferase [Caballeronia sp. LZ062]|uniref:phosphoribosyltransferase n=1 Tax=unclassified Caballeronia TaxID=2646786 RepID=UPI0028572CF4|nr:MULTISPECIES: phosphoribosyltransferase [unclassified Caballeronia]MDR5857564.1 phosphoribosyltransferase [Caballeronia sp. LZ050]MDR5869114.1 phosphoribosyltransferase [Caballeronia sp. LZ062]
MNSIFRDRREAGRELAALLSDYAHRDDVIVLGLPRGGVPVAFEVASALGVEMDVLVVRKLGVPYQPELAMGAIASGDAFYLDERIVDYAGVSTFELDAVIERERAELARREAMYRGLRPPLDTAGKVAIVVDDGMATGATLRAAVMSLRNGDAPPAQVVAAVPVSPEDAATRLAGVVDACVCVLQPRHFLGVGQFYIDFDQTSDDEVRTLLKLRG